MSDKQGTTIVVRVTRPLLGSTDPLQFNDWITKMGPGTPRVTEHGFTVWFIGLPSSGKSTLAALLWKELRTGGVETEILDGDEIREKLTKELGYSRADREENLRRIAHVAKLATRVGAVAIVAGIFPSRASRDAARREVDKFVEVYVERPVEAWMQRDCKGHYKKEDRKRTVAGFHGRFGFLRAAIVSGSDLEHQSSIITVQYKTTCQAT